MKRPTDGRSDEGTDHNEEICVRDSCSLTVIVDHSTPCRIISLLFLINTPTVYGVFMFHSEAIIRKKKEVKQHQGTTLIVRLGLLLHGRPILINNH